MKIEKADGVKCPRCWHYHVIAANHDHLCDRCIMVILEDYPGSETAAAIKANLADQRKQYTPPRLTKTPNLA